MPADLFKKAPETFRRQVMTIVNLILTGHYKYKPADLEARVILTLICKDASIQNSLAVEALVGQQLCWPAESSRLFSQLLALTLGRLSWR